MTKLQHFSRCGVAAALLAVVPCGLTSCDSPTGQGAAIGAGAGALIGAAASGGRPGAVLAGAAAGALTGTLIGASVEESNAEAYGERPRDGYPYASRTGHPGFVVSPYPPHYTIDVRSVPRHALVRDPSCDRLFVNP